MLSSSRLKRAVFIVVATGLLWASLARTASAQLSALVSPGPLARSHAALDGIANCQKCHERGRKVTAEKCLVCHAPVADRIAKRIGVHKDANGDCVRCHAEHAGADGVLRAFDEKRFDHVRVTGFSLNDRHASVAHQCAACHKTRSFLSVSRDCAACHRDAHKGAFGRTCTNCHSARTSFREISGQFDHAGARFRLTGAHTTAACAKCHVNNVVRGIKFASCANCHRDPHTPAFAAPCASCHTTMAWRTNKVEHDRTSFPLRGRHATVACAACHQRTGGQAPVRLASFRSTSRTCATCHRDVHFGQVGGQCERCHGDTSFAVRNFRHTGSNAVVLSAGRHGRAACSACHKRATGVFPAGHGTAIRFAIDARCTACHTDVHRGSLGPNCVRCHKP